MFTVQKSQNWFPNPVLLTLESAHNGKLPLFNTANIGKLRNQLAKLLCVGAFNAVIKYNFSVDDT